MAKDLNYSIAGIEVKLDCALEHASHAWSAFERETNVNRTNPEMWPPKVDAPVGSAQYHFAAVLQYIFDAYQMVRKEQDHTEQVMEKVNKFLSK